jgi:SRSO17 transposase
VLALDDFINPKVGRKIFGCEAIFDHAAKSNQSRYPWAQNVVALGLLKQIKGRWACLPLAFRFYLPKKAIEAKTLNVKKGARVEPFQTKLAQAGAMIIAIASHFAGVPVLVVSDSWFGNNGLFQPVREALGLQFHLLSRLRVTSMLYDLPPQRTPKQRGAKRKYGQKLGSVATLAAQFRDRAQRHRVYLYGKSREVLAYQQVFMLKTLKCPVRVVWVYRKTQWVALFTTDLRLSLAQIVSLYGARWKIESGFKELKQEIGSQKSQTRNAYAVINHLQLCMMAASLTWIYAERLRPNPQRRHKVKGRTSFAFSDVRRIIAEAALSEDFEHVCPKPTSPPHKSLVDALLRMVA